MIEHRGLAQFRQGAFGNGGDNLFVDATGVIRRIMDNDLNGNGIFDIVLPNSHGYVERAPTYIYTEKEGEWQKLELPHDSCWLPKAEDVDGDGYLDLIIVNGENGVTSELQSYIYWGGPNGLTGDYTTFDTIGAYDAVVCDLGCMDGAADSGGSPTATIRSGSGLKSVIFSTAWYDHHNPGVPLNQRVFVQTAPRQFADATEQYGLAGLATTSLVCEDLNGDGFPELVLANYRKDYANDTDSFIYWGSPDGFDITRPTLLPTHYALQVLAADLNGDGFKELIFTGGHQVIIYWNNAGVFDADNRLVLDIRGTDSQFNIGLLVVDVADIDADGVVELVIGTADGVEIRKSDDLQRIWQRLPCYGCSYVKAADIRNNGRMDILTSHYCSSKSYDTQSLVFWNSEQGFDAGRFSAFDTHGPMGCLAADLDQDGVKELIFCNTMKGPSQYDPAFPVFAYFGTPDYRYEVANRREYPVNIGCHTYAAADVDNDGHVELIVTTGEGVRIFRGTPDGPDPADYYDLVHTPGSLVLVGGVLLGDFNRNGWLDLLMVPWVYGGSEEELAHSVFVYFGGPDGYSHERRMSLPAYVQCAQAILLADTTNSGYLDFLYGDSEGFVGIYYGGPDGFNPERTGRIRLKDHNGALIMGLAAADADKDGWLELYVTTAGHYTRIASHVYVLQGGADGYAPERTKRFETGGTTGFPALADMSGSGNLDLLLPFYSTADTRELPARIFRGDGQGNFDWEHPQTIDCLASIAFCPVDLTGNGYPDLFICCHRDNIGHQVDSKLILNGPNGLDPDSVRNIPGYGPHSFTAKNQGNARDRSDKEIYTSPVFGCGEDKPRRLIWEAECPHRTSLVFRIRCGSSPEETLGSAWSSEIHGTFEEPELMEPRNAARSGDSLGTPRYESVIDVPVETRYMQYQAIFRAPGLVNSPRLTAVIIES